MSLDVCHVCEAKYQVQDAADEDAAVGDGCASGSADPFTAECMERSSSLVTPGRLSSGSSCMALLTAISTSA
jgi:hypothetical protein